MGFVCSVVANDAIDYPNRAQSGSATRLDAIL
jgi:hypothetical protein